MTNFYKELKFEQSRFPSFLLILTMTHREENKGKAAVPKFGAWDQKPATGGVGGGGEFTGYSVVFTKAREKRKQAKVEAPPVDLSAAQDAYPHPKAHHDHEAQTKHAHHHHHRPRRFHPKAPPFDLSANKDDPNKGMKKLLQCWGGGSGSSKE